MKKLFLVLVVALMVSFLRCAPAAAETAAPAEPQAPEATTAPADTVPPAAAKPILAVCLPALDNPLMLAFQDAFKGAFGAEYDVQVSSADGNANTQATQIENYTAMKPFMFVMAVEATSLVPSWKRRARRASR